jgi:hypothetical protein
LLNREDKRLQFGHGDTSRLWGGFLSFRYGRGAMSGVGRMPQSSLEATAGKKRGQAMPGFIPNT